MRGGYFLAEETPDRLMHQFGAESLEEVFLKLSVMQNRGKRRRSSILQVVTETITVPSGEVNTAAVLDDELGEISGEFGDNVSMSSRGGRRVSIVPDDLQLTAPELPPDEEVKLTWKERISFFKINHMRALIWKNFLWMWRNVPIILFLIGLPIMQVILFCLAIGKDPTDLSLSIANFELEEKETCKYKLECNSTRLSCSYLSYLEKRTLQLVSFIKPDLIISNFKNTIL